MKKIVSMLLAFSMLLSLAACSSKDDEKKEKSNGSKITAENEGAKADLSVETTVSVGDYIEFGSYEQDNDTSNGKEAIEWLVLDKKENKILVISKYALDCHSYYESIGKITWENCTLRSWLNNEFLNTAFTSNEMSNISNENIKAEDNTKYNTEAGNDTQDKVFLLSISEANKYFSSDDARKCKPTVYAKEKGTYISENEDYYGNCVWWLRTPGYDLGYATRVDYDGIIHDHGNDIEYSYNAVRPAMWINF